MNEEFTTIESIFDSISSTYLISFTTVLLAVVLAYYISNSLKDVGCSSNKQPTNSCMTASSENADLPAEEEDVDEEEEEEEEDDTDETDLEQEQYELNGEQLLKGKLNVAKRIKQLEAQLTADQLEEERRVEREQLAAIFELLKQQEAKLNMPEIDESELTKQLRLYR